jgi:hypothetical protein
LAPRSVFLEAICWQQVTIALGGVSSEPVIFGDLVARLNMMMRCYRNTVAKANFEGADAKDNYNTLTIRVSLSDLERQLRLKSLVSRHLPW